MQNYLDLMREVRDHGHQKSDRTGTGTRSLFGRSLRFDLSKSFPLVTTKQVHLKSIIHELLWFLSGSTNIKYLRDNGVTIWDEWADEKGELGPVYGKQWRLWEGPDGVFIDQLLQVVSQIKNNPDSRRMIVSAWNPADIPKMALPPCHVLYQFYVAEERLSCQMYQRSADLFLGVPFNIASYALLTLMIADICDLEPGDLSIVFGDVHIYDNHRTQVDLQLSRTPRPEPVMTLLRSPRTFADFRYEDFQLTGYNPYPAIKAPVAV